MCLKELRVREAGINKGQGTKSVQDAQSLQVAHAQPSGY